MFPLFTPLKRFVALVGRRLHSERPLVIADVPADPRTVVCNICGFTPTHGYARICPRCGTNQRQRSFRQLFATVLEPEIFRASARDGALLLSPGAVELLLLRSKFPRCIISSLYQRFEGEKDFVAADVRDLAPFADGSFDYVQACNVLDYVPEMRSAIEAVRRVLKPNGTFVFLVPEPTLIDGEAPIAVSVRASVTGKYWPDAKAVPLVSVGRTTLFKMLESAGFAAREIRFNEPLSELMCTWWVCQRS